MANELRQKLERFNDDSPSSSSFDSEASSPLLWKLGGNSTDQSRGRRFPYGLIVALVLGISVFCNVILLIHQFKTWDMDRICNAHTSQYSSPVLKDVDITYRTVQFSASLANVTIYRQPPSLEVDEAWENLGADYEPFTVLEDEAELYGLQKGQVKRTPEEGGGFFAEVEALHYIHCLNLLRQTSIWNYAYYRKRGKGAFMNTDDVVRDHTGHCLEILRQQLMCTADVGIFGQWWVEGYGAYVDFNTKHKCKNFEDIRRWAEERQISRKTSHARKRPGDIILPEIP
ncbi:hypothetical protein AJ80_02183 [Polytolypa hystricis UAMH7299]|uniref:Tat pathway signal sequence n=1 Tax=Polytolypa hystricis (strain UAMH7299) TaxID=1447883 RepID=A0A2B7YRY5_POLH7|nr:hypothetical protein AJ80_02183 [Polytolypa hystricis UAMH7299]